ncbi:hypothetical protein DFH09DRAFT_1372457 [Mycena vulgaris]|nr:hypothetical protein DFH09DRAFT_1372457 [Mycena vulgaris]
MDLAYIRYGSLVFAGPRLYSPGPLLHYASVHVRRHVTPSAHRHPIDNSLQFQQSSDSIATSSTRIRRMDANSTLRPFGDDLGIRLLVESPSSASCKQRSSSTSPPHRTRTLPLTPPLPHTGRRTHATTKRLLFLDSNIVKAPNRWSWSWRKQSWHPLLYVAHADSLALIRECIPPLRAQHVHLDLLPSPPVTWRLLCLDTCASALPAIAPVPSSADDTSSSRVCICRALLIIPTPTIPPSARPARTAAIPPRASAFTARQEGERSRSGGGIGRRARRVEAEKRGSGEEESFPSFPSYLSSLPPFALVPFPPSSTFLALGPYLPLFALVPSFPSLRHVHGGRRGARASTARIRRCRFLLCVGASRAARVTCICGVRGGRRALLCSCVTPARVRGEMGSASGGGEQRRSGEGDAHGVVFAGAGMCAVDGFGAAGVGGARYVDVQCGVGGDAMCAAPPFLFFFLSFPSPRSPLLVPPPSSSPRFHLSTSLFVPPHRSLLASPRVRLLFLRASAVRSMRQRP